ncbi:MAG: DUF4169 family protein [Yoonia sp.]|nr:DUF4169 family protein [Yoonia sp.]MDG1862951.1 DUF4169 family protein [Yoonia sp.]
MSVVNLNKARKAKTKAEEKAQADENAARFGRSKAQRVLDAANAALANSRHAAHQFEDE